MGSNDHDPSRKKIYVAGASREKDLCKGYMKRLREAGFDVVSTWPEAIEGEGGKTDAELSIDDKIKYAHQDLAQLESADLFWLITPRHEHPTKGAWIELGFALSYMPPRFIVVSGDTRACIFATLAGIRREPPSAPDAPFVVDSVPYHEAAFQDIVRKWGPK